MNIAIFAGPAKTGSSWFYYQFINHPQVYVLGQTKDFNPKIKSTSILKKEIDRLPNRYKLIVIINHDLLKNKEYKFIKSFNPDCYLVYRDSFERLKSGILEKVKTGRLSKKELLGASTFDDLPKIKKSLKYKENGYLFFMKNLIKNKIKVKIINFDFLSQENIIFDFFSTKYNLDKSFFIKEKVINKRGILKFSFLSNFIIYFIKKPLIFFGLSKIWSFIKLSFIRDLFLSDVPKNILEKCDDLMNKDVQINYIINDDKVFVTKFNSYFIKK